ncbi:MAG TPA: cyclic nucleotide-binding domain-containing protein, partial [Allosphingosinicella sp.]
MATAPIGTNDNGDPIAGLLLKLRRRDTVSDREADVLRGAVEGVETHPAGAVLTRPDERLTQSTLLLDGLAARYKDLSEGQRQITELHVPGDFIDLHGYLLKRIEHHIGALTAVRIALVPHRNVVRITEQE